MAGSETASYYFFLQGAGYAAEYRRPIIRTGIRPKARAEPMKTKAVMENA